MNYREDLEIKLQKVTLAMQEVEEDIYKTDQDKQRIILKLIIHMKKIFNEIKKYYPNLFTIYWSFRSASTFFRRRKD